MSRCLATAQHEAAHVVVGVALGLRVERAWVRDRDPGAPRPPRGALPDDLGMVVWATTRSNLAYAIMCAAGIAWEQQSGGHLAWASVDRRLVRRYLRAPGRRADVRTAVACATAILRDRAAVHARVARLLAERDVTSADVDQIASGGRRGRE